MLLMTAFTIKMMQAIMNISRMYPQYYNMNGTGFMLAGIDGSSYIMIMGIAVALAACSDFENHTVKTIFARGYSRTQFYMSNLTAVAAAITVSFAVTMLSSLAIGTAFFGTGSADAGKVAGLLATQYIAVLANTAFIYMIGSMLKRTGPSIALAIVVPTVSILILQIADLLLMMADVKMGDVKLADYWISSCFTNLSNLLIAPAEMITCAVLCAVYTAVFTVLGAMRCRKAEV